MNVVCNIRSQHIRDYLHYLFEVSDSAFSISRETKEGKFICSMVKYSDFPIDSKVNESTTVYLRMPNTSEMPLLFKRFCYLTLDDQIKIEDYLKASFDLDFFQYYFTGKSLGVQQKVVIETFILSRKLANLIGNTEQLKKRQYRSEEKTLRQMADRLAKRVRVRNAIIHKTIQEFQKII